MPMLLWMIFPDSPELTSLGKSLMYLKYLRNCAKEFKEKKKDALSESEVIMARNLKTASLMTSVLQKESVMSFLLPLHLSKMELWKEKTGPYKNLPEQCYMPKDFLCIFGLKL